jgi:double-strand break repair protein MRE11
VQIRGKEYTIKPIPLRTVRPFVMDSIVLAEAAEEENVDINDALKLKQYLAGKVNQLIKKAEREWKERQQEAADEGGEGHVKIDVEDNMLPLVRLRVDTTGTTPSFNPIRFSLEFTGRVANPRDVLVFHRAPRRAQRQEPITAPDSGLVGELEDPDISITEKLQKVRVGALVKEYLSAQELQLLGEDGLSEAISSFVEKDDSHSIERYSSNPHASSTH